MPYIVGPTDSIDHDHDNDDQISQYLLTCVKSKKLKEANTLLEKYSYIDVNNTDEVGCTALHYAALVSSVDLTVKLIERGGKVKQVDVNGETPVHKAARKGNMEVVIALVAYGADINILNLSGESALEVSVKQRDENLVALFCKLGAEACLQDWTWTMGETSKKDDYIVDLLVEQSSRYPGYKYGSIAFRVLHIKRDNRVEISSLGVKIKTEHVLGDFYLYCSKMQSQFTDFRDRLQLSERLFSEVFEFVSFGKRPKTLAVEIKLAGMPSCSESLSFLSVEGSYRGKMDVNYNRIDDEDHGIIGFTMVNLNLTFGKNGRVIFAIISTETPETFNVNDEAVCIQPVMEPEAEIDIPKGTFDGPSQLHVMVSETKSFNLEETAMGEPILVTNVLDLTMLDGMQPKKAINMKMPLHSKLDEEIIILACHKEYPENDEDWEISELESQRKKNFVVFKVEHFSWHVAALRKHSEKAIPLATQAIKKERTIEIFAMTKFESDGHYTLIFECVQKKFGKRRRKHWKEKGFESQMPEYFTSVEPVYQSFRLLFLGNIPIEGDHAGDIKIQFNPDKKKNVLTFYMVRCDQPPSGEINVEKIFKTKEIPPPKEAFPEVKPQLCPCCFSCSSIDVKPQDVPTKPKIKYCYQFLTKLPVNAKSPEETDLENFKESKIDPNDPECPIKLTVLRWSSLKHLCAGLTDEECYRLGVQLNIAIKTLNELQTDVNFKEKMVEKWRPKRPYESLVESLINGLERINKQYEADLVREAHVKETEFRYKMVSI